MNAKACPECESINTEKQWEETQPIGHTQTLTCNDCPTQFTVHYTYSHTETDWTENEE